MIFLSITKFIITTEGVFLLHTEQDKKQIKIITLGELNRRAEDIDTFIGTSENSGGGREHSAVPQTKAAGAFVGTVRFGQNHNGISHSGCACEKGY